MGVDAGDFDNDGDEDLFVTELVNQGSSLFVNDGSATFEEQSTRLGVRHPSLPYTGFGAAWFDYDNDGWLDLFIANGAVTLLESRQVGVSPYAQRKQLFHNEGGKRFRETSQLAGPSFQIAEVSRGAAFGDIDNDGAIDIVVTNNNGPVRLFRNQAGKKAHWLSLKLESPKLNRFAIGARVALIRHGKQTPWRQVRTDSSYLSANDLRVHFGLGDRPEIDAVIVQWPDRSLERFDGIKADRIVTIGQGSGQRVTA
jgi:hypothetical protein